MTDDCHIPYSMEPTGNDKRLVELCISVPGIDGSIKEAIVVMDANERIIKELIFEGFPREILSVAYKATPGAIKGLKIVRTNLLTFNKKYNKKILKFMSYFICQFNILLLSLHKCMLTEFNRKNEKAKMIILLDKFSAILNAMDNITKKSLDNFEGKTGKIITMSLIEVFAVAMMYLQKQMKTDKYLDYFFKDLVRTAVRNNRMLTYTINTETGEQNTIDCYELSRYIDVLDIGTPETKEYILKIIYMILDDSESYYLNKSTDPGIEYQLTDESYNMLVHIKNYEFSKRSTVMKNYDRTVAYMTLYYKTYIIYWKIYKRIVKKLCNTDKIYTDIREFAAYLHALNTLHKIFTVQIESMTSHKISRIMMQPSLLIPYPNDYDAKTQPYFMLIYRKIRRLMVRKAVLYTNVYHQFCACSTYSYFFERTYEMNTEKDITKEELLERNIYYGKFSPSELHKFCSNTDFSLTREEKDTIDSWFT